MENNSEFSFYALWIIFQGFITSQKWRFKREIRRCYTRFFREDEHKLLLREQCVRVRARLTTFEIQGSSVLLWKILRSAVDDLWSTICRNALSLQGSCEHNGELAIRKEDESKVCKAGYCYARWYCKHLLILISFICLFHSSRFYYLAYFYHPTVFSSIISLNSLYHLIRFSSDNIEIKD